MHVRIANISRLIEATEGRLIAGANSTAIYSYTKFQGSQLSGSVGSVTGKTMRAAKAISESMRELTIIDMDRFLIKLDPFDEDEPLDKLK